LSTFIFIVIFIIVIVIIFFFIVIFIYKVILIIILILVHFIFDRASGQIYLKANGANAQWTLGPTNLVGQYRMADFGDYGPSLIDSYTIYYHLIAKLFHICCR